MVMGTVMSYGEATDVIVHLAGKEHFVIWVSDEFFRIMWLACLCNPPPLLPPFVNLGFIKTIGAPT